MKAAPHVKNLISTAEFIPLAALLTCLTALSIDIMLPVLPQLAAGLGVADPNDRQWVVTSYLSGLIVGQLIVGTVSDRYGRLPILFGGLMLFVAGALVASTASSFAWLLAARAMQGIGGAAPRVIVMAVVRDLYSGRQMARILSLVMTVFIMVPVFAPSLGQLIGLYGGWRMVILTLAIVGSIAFIWAWRRLPETSPRHRRDQTGAPPTGHGAPVALHQALFEVLRSRPSVGYIAANGCMFGCLMSYILSSQQIFVDIYQMGPLFPVAFGAIAVAMALAGFVNSRIVERLGMRIVSHRALLGFILIASASAVSALLYQGRPPLWIFWGGLWLQFFFFGLIVHNFNAMAMEPLGKVAGTASSLMGSYTSLCGAGLGATVGQFFNMTTLPLNIGFALFAGAAFIIVLITERGHGFGRDASA